MPKRITITVPNPIHRQLSKLSVVRDKPLATLAAEAVEQFVKAAEEDGAIPPAEAFIRSDDDNG